MNKHAMHIHIKIKPSIYRIKTQNAVQLHALENWYCGFIIFSSLMLGLYYAGGGFVHFFVNVGRKSINIKY